MVGHVGTHFTPHSNPKSAFNGSKTRITTSDILLRVPVWEYCAAWICRIENIHIYNILFTAVNERYITINHIFQTMGSGVLGNSGSLKKKILNYCF